MGHVEVVQLLVDRGCNLFLQDKRGLNALDWARRGRHEDVVVLLEAAIERRIAGERALILQRREEAAIDDLANTNVGLANGLNKALSEGASLEKVRRRAFAACIAVGR